jgi:hypothetical protein
MTRQKFNLLFLGEAKVIAANQLLKNIGLGSAPEQTFAPHKQALI